MKILVTEQQLNNNTITAYHGSNHEFNIFKNDLVGGQDAIDAQGPGVYFTDTKYDAQHFGKFIYSVNLIPNKILSDQNMDGIDENIISKLIKLKPDWEMNAYDWDEDLENGLQKSINAIFDNDNAKDVITQVYIEYYIHQPIDYVKNCVKLGIDGISHVNMWGDGKTTSQHYIIYNPTIIHINKKELNNSN